MFTEDRWENPQGCSTPVSCYSWTHNFISQLLSGVRHPLHPYQPVLSLSPFICWPGILSHIKGGGIGWHHCPTMAIHKKCQYLVSDVCHNPCFFCLHYTWTLHIFFFDLHVLLRHKKFKIISVLCLSYYKEIISAEYDQWYQAEIQNCNNEKHTVC